MKLFGKKPPRGPAQPAAVPTPAKPAMTAATARSTLNDDDYYGSHVQMVSLSAPLTPAPAPAPAPAPEKAAAPSLLPERPRFGIDDAVRLMRNLPVNENPELVVQVLKTTLESLQIQLDDIIDEASQKEKALDQRLTVLRREIVQLERDIQQRRDEIVSVDRDLAETGAVRQRLLLAERRGEGSPAGHNGVQKGGAGNPAA